MGQSASRQCKRPDNNSPICDAFWPSSARANVSRLMQGCLDARHTLGGDNETDYYDHVNGISYLIHRRIGRGELSEVFDASRLSSAGALERFAIKVYRSRALDRQQRIRAEIAILGKLGTYCRQIVRMHHHSEIFDDETGQLEAKLVLDRCSGGTLRERMKKTPMDEKAVRITQALHFLHTRRVIHCDVKPENVLFVDNVGLTIKLSDFGVAKASNDNMSIAHYTLFNNSDIYLAPEILAERPYGTQADMWSLGITVYHCLTGHLPFQKGNSLRMGVCQEIVSGSFIRTALSNANFPEYISFDALRFLEKLLRVDPNERMNVVEALNHRWLQADMSVKTKNQTHMSSSIPQSNVSYYEDYAGIGTGGNVQSIGSPTESLSTSSSSLNELNRVRKQLTPSLSVGEYIQPPQKYHIPNSINNSNNQRLLY